MNRKQFLDKLKNRLWRLSQDELEDVLRYYNEYFDDAGEQNEHQVILDLGNPEKLATQILAESTINNIRPQAKTRKSGISCVWWVLLGIFASPIAIPIALVLAFISFVLVIIVIGIALAISGTVIALVVAGISMIVLGISSALYHLPTALLMIGIAMVCIGLPVCVFPSIVVISKKCFERIALLIGKYLPRRENK